MTNETRPTRDRLSPVLAVLAALGLIVGGLFLFRFVGGLPAGPTTPIIVTPGGEDVPGPQTPEEPQTGIPIETIRDLALALAGVITAMTGLLGLLIRQMAERREEARRVESHLLELERERLALERERLKLEQERLALERRRGVGNK